MEGTQKQRKNLSHWSMTIIFAMGFTVVSCSLAPKGPKKEAPHSWRRDRGPVVPHDTFPTDCTLCHVEGVWHEIRDDFQFDHGLATGTALFGAHAEAQCLRCHNDRGPVKVFAQRGCVGCHTDLHRGQLGSQCQQCHNELNWIPEGQFALHNRTRFPLVGAHTAVACFRCHEGAQVGNFARAPVDCESCHQQDAQRATKPDHLIQGWTQECERCHQPIAWQGTAFNHAKFPLYGAHRTVDCSKCHNSGVFAGLPHDCASCHIRDFHATKNPNHTAAGFPTKCEQCHTTVAWTDATFNHRGISTNCALCHLAHYHATRNPNHAASGFPTNCEACHHNTNAWTPAVFNHAGIVNNCSKCHITDFNGTKNPNHLALNFRTNCEACHNTSMWKPATFNHVGITKNCSRCHLPDYNATTKPSHAASGFPTNCESCHTTNTWTPAMFNHAGITNNCISCHLPDYNATNSPNHAAVGFPTNCESCHNTNRWEGAVFTHAFNINSGPHKKFSCVECHKVPTNYTIVSCTHCHDHNRVKMDDKHKGIPAYVWSSSACVSCHPNGRK